MSNPWALWLRNNQPHRYNLASKVGWHDFVHSPPRASLELLTKGQIAALSDDEREDYNEARFVWNANLPTVKTAQLTHAFAVIDQVMASNRRDGDRLRGSVVIDAPPGLGKTTIAIRYAKAVPSNCNSPPQQRDRRRRSAYSGRLHPARCWNHPQGPEQKDPRLLWPSGGSWCEYFWFGCARGRLRTELRDSDNCHR